MIYKKGKKNYRNIELIVKKIADHKLASTIKEINKVKTPVSVKPFELSTYFKTLLCIILGLFLLFIYYFFLLIDRNDQIMKENIQLKEKLIEMQNQLVILSTKLENVVTDKAIQVTTETATYSGYSFDWRMLLVSSILFIVGIGLVVYVQSESTNHVLQQLSENASNNTMILGKEIINSNHRNLDAINQGVNNIIRYQKELNIHSDKNISAIFDAIKELQINMLEKSEELSGLLNALINRTSFFIKKDNTLSSESTVHMECVSDSIIKTSINMPANLDNISLVVTNVAVDNTTIIATEVLTKCI